MDPHIAADQSAVFAFLGDPATYGLSEPVKRIDTHGAVVFLAGPDVYKVKRAVRFSYMDFSTLAKRRAACEGEIAVNRDNAPTLYLGAVPITRDAKGLHLGGDGEIVEWVVHLRRFDEEATLDRLAEKGPLGAALVDKLAAAVATAHRRAPRADGPATAEPLRRALAATADELVHGTDIFPSGVVAALVSRLTQAFDQAAALLRRRHARGQVRRCHGDLHLRNIALIDGKPVLFDAIEFDEALATIDILYDLAFLVMDLWHRGLHADANRLLNRYLAAAEDEAMTIEGLALLPLFLSLRAAIRAKVGAALFRLDGKRAALRDEALGYVAAASRFLDPVPPRLVAIGGLSGTGKSTLAASLAPGLGTAPGALHRRSDVERKRLIGVAETERLPAEAYRPEVATRVYDRLGDRAATALRAGRCVIVDATFQEPSEREAIEAVALEAGVRFVGLWLEAPLPVLTARVSARRNDASDATADVVAAQAKAALGVIAWQRLDAARPIPELAAAAAGFLA